MQMDNIVSGYRLLGICGYGIWHCYLRHIRVLNAGGIRMTTLVCYRKLAGLIPRFMPFGDRISGI